MKKTLLLFLILFIFPFNFQGKNNIEAASDCVGQWPGSDMQVKVYDNATNNLLGTYNASDRSGTGESYLDATLPPVPYGVVLRFEGVATAPDQNADSFTVYPYDKIDQIKEGFIQHNRVWYSQPLTRGDSFFNWTIDPICNRTESQGWDGGHGEINININVIPPTGTVCVGSNVASSGTISGTWAANWNGTMTCFPNLPVGPYTVNGVALPGYSGPTYNANPQTLTKDDTIIFNLNYTANSLGSFNLSANSCSGGSNRFDLSWSSSQYATSYDVYAKAWSGGAWNKIGSTGGTSFSTNQAWDTDWYFYVKAINSGSTRDSDPNGGIFGGNCASTPPPPPPPGGYPAPVCSPASQTVQAGVNANFSVSGGNNSYVWSSPSGNPTGGTGSGFSTTYGAPGSYTVTVSSANQSSNCSVTVTSSPPPTPISVWVDRPACSNGPYTATINWSGLSASGLGLFVDVTTDSTFGGLWSKRFQNAPIPVSTVALTGFSCDAANFCPGAPVGEPMSLEPDKTYYTRVYAAPGTHYPSTAGVSFRVPRCSPVIPAPTKPVWDGAPVCVASTGTYVVGIDWEGAPNPTFGTYIDIDTDSNWDDVNLYDWWNKNIPPLGGTYSNSNNFDGFYPLTNNRLVMRPATNYFARMYTAYPAWGVHSATSDALNVPVCTLEGTLTASPSSGTGPLNTTLTATKTAGSASGTITYQFDCTNDGTYEGTVGPTASASATYAGCPSYPGRQASYTARVKITQKDALGQDVVEEKTTLITSNPIPLKPDLIPSNFRTIGPVIAGESDKIFYSTISNTGLVPTPSSVEYFFQFCNVAAAATQDCAAPINKPFSSVLAIGPNSSVDVSESHTFASAGTRSGRVCADRQSPSSLPLDGKILESNEGNNCGAWTDVVVSNAVPSVGNVTISSSVVNPNDINQYTIKISGTDLSGASDIKYLEVLINRDGTNAGQHRGLLIWNPGAPLFPVYNSGSVGVPVIESKSCGGGTGYIFASNFNPSYIHLVSCSVSDSGNTREVSFVVRFDTTFTTPLTDNDMSGIVGDNSNQFSPWVNFDGFDLLSATSCVVPPALKIASSGFSPTTVNVNDNVNVWCDFGLAFNSIRPYVGAVSDCVWVNFTGTVSNYTCKAPQAGTQTVSCGTFNRPLPDTNYCATNTNLPGSLTVVNTGPTGTLTVSPPCVIASGDPSCNVTVGWNTFNRAPGSTINVTKSNPDGVVSSAVSGPVATSIRGGSSTSFYLYHIVGGVSTLLAGPVATTPSCAANSTWNDGTQKCEPNIPQFEVKVDPQPIGGKVVSVSAPGIDCGGDCSNMYNQNTNISLQAIPNSSYWEFVGWTDACSSFGKSFTCNINVNGAKTVGAVFTLRDFKYHEF